MNIDFAALISFALITTFTPGPNNISSAAMGVNFGYSRTLKYVSGIAAGFFIVQVVSGLLSGTLSELVPGFERALSIIGALYILWLAWHTLKASYGIDENAASGKPLKFITGLLLQLVNPKGIIYGITIYSTFLKDIKIMSPLFPAAALCFSALAFIATSCWALFGTLISRFMHSRRIRLSVNIVLSLMLVWTALKISGVLTFSH